MRSIQTAALVSVAAFGLSGCATVMNGTSQDVDFRSDPEGAQVELINGLTCETPCSYSMRRGDDSRAIITKEGYEPATVYIQSRTGGATFGNILAGGIIGGVVDGSNGASNHLYPNPVYIRLAPAGSGEDSVLLDKKGEVVSTLDEYNAKVASDVLKGLEGQGYFPRGQAAAHVSAGAETSAGVNETAQTNAAAEADAGTAVAIDEQND